MHQQIYIVSVSVQQLQLAEPLPLPPVGPEPGLPVELELEPAAVDTEAVESHLYMLEKFVDPKNALVN